VVRQEDGAKGDPVEQGPVVEPRHVVLREHLVAEHLPRFLSGQIDVKPGVVPAVESAPPAGGPSLQNGQSLGDRFLADQLLQRGQLVGLDGTLEKKL